MEVKTYNSNKRVKFTDNLIGQLQTGKGTSADAFIQAGYEAKTRQIAKQNASRLKKHPEVQATLKSYRDYLKEYMPTNIRAEKLTEHALSEDKRVSLQALQEISRIQDEYPDKKIKITALDERQEVIE